jgi:glycosyltransferase involved in cell wall biosynthesis
MNGLDTPYLKVDSNTGQETNKRLNTVDVVVPCYNYARYLGRCVNSVLMQPDVKVRVLVIDDASTDDTPQVGEALASSDRRVEYRRHLANKGHIETYNEGLIGWSSADYVVLLSADDMLAPGSLSRAVTVMNNDDRIGMVYGRTIHFKKDIQLPVKAPRGFKFTRWSGASWLERRCRAGHNVITSPEVVVRGRIQRSVGGYRPQLPHAGDLEMWLRIAAISDIGYVKQVQAFYRVHPQSMIRTVYSGGFFDLQQRKEAFDSFFEHNSDRLPNADRLQNLANRSLAREALWDACRAYDRNKIEERRAGELIAFAAKTLPGVDLLPEYAALRRRQSLGPSICQRTQVFAVSALVRKISRWVSKLRWKRLGV